MSTEQIILLIAGGVAAIWALFKVILPRLVDAKLKTLDAQLKAEDYNRVRFAFREDKTFEMLEDTLEHWKVAHTEERQEAIAAQKQQTALITEIGRLAANVNRQTDMIRILVQQVSVFNDRIRTIEDKIIDGQQGS